MVNKMVRFILKLRPRFHIGDEELKTVGMLKVEDRVRQLKLNHVFKIDNEVPEFSLHQTYQHPQVQYQGQCNQFSCSKN